MSENALFTLLYPLLFMILIAVAVKFWVRRQVRVRNAGSELRLLQQLPVGQRESLVLVELAGERMLLGITAHHIRLLSSLSRSTDATENGTGVHDFLEK